VGSAAGPSRPAAPGLGRAPFWGGEWGLTWPPGPAGRKPTVGAAFRPVIFRGNPPPLRAPWLAIGRAVLPCDVPTVRYDGTDPPSCYTLQATFSPGTPRCGAAYDEQDHYYAPLWGWGPDLDRTGPEVRIYRNECGARAPGRAPTPEVR